MGKLKILMISDLHQYFGDHNGIDESYQFKWLVGIVHKEKPDMILSAGDWQEMTDDHFEELMDYAIVHSAYGNHDNLSQVKYLHNRNGKKVFPTRTISYDELSIGFIHGTLGVEGKIYPHLNEKHTEGSRWWIRTPSDMQADISILRRAPPTILVTHESPILFLEYNQFNPVMIEAAKTLRPKLHLSGHMHGESILMDMFGTKVLRLNSAAGRRDYAIATVDHDSLDVKLIT